MYLLFTYLPNASQIFIIVITVYTNVVLAIARFYRHLAQYGNTQYVKLIQQCTADNAELEDNDHIDPQSRLYQKTPQKYCRR